MHQPAQFNVLPLASAGCADHPLLEDRLKMEAKRLGVTQSAFIVDALERVLGLKDPAALLAQVRSSRPMGRPTASEDTASALKARLHAKRAG